MSHIATRLKTLCLQLPPPTRPPPGVVLPFAFVHVVGTRALIYGHGPQSPDGSFAQPLGKLGRDVSVEQGYAAARLTALSMLGSLQRARWVTWTASAPGPGCSAWSTRRPASTVSRA
jgi:hypothetical protein